MLMPESSPACGILITINFTLSAIALFVLGTGMLLRSQQIALQ
jgi:hypothetical protein